MRNKFPNFVGHIQKTFIAGLLLCFPILITFFVLRFLFGFIDPLLKPLLGFVPWISDHTTGISAAITLALIYVIGLISGHVLGKRIVKFFLHFLPQRVPFINKIYSLAKAFTDAIAPEDTKKATGKVVFVQLSPFDPKPKAIGLLMNILGILKENKSGELQGPAELHGVVFFSSTPFPQSGQLLYFPLNKISDLKVPIGDKGETKNLWMTQKEFRRFLKQEEYIGIIGSMATISPKTLICKSINVEDFNDTKPANKS